jgi:hypothetical protein
VYRHTVGDNARSSFVAGAVALPRDVRALSRLQEGSGLHAHCFGLPYAAIKRLLHAPQFIRQQQLELQAGHTCS